MKGYVPFRTWTACSDGAVCIQGHKTGCGTKLRQHQDRGGEDTWWRGTDEDEGFPGVAEPLSVRRQVRAPRQGQRQGRCGRTRGLCTAELHGPDPECQQLGRVEHLPGRTVSQAA